MVYKKVITVTLLLQWLFQITLQCQTRADQTSTTFQVYWIGTHQESCSKLVKIFLHELEDFIPERPIELKSQNEFNSATKDSILLECDSQQIDFIALKDPQKIKPEISMRYLEKAEGFDHLGWLEFQKNYLRPPSELKLEDLAPKAVKVPDLVAKSEPSNENTSPIYKKWWFWTGIGVIAAGFGSYFLAKNLNSSSTMRVEIK